VLLAVMCASCALQAQSTLTVAAAADLGSALREISVNFEKRSGTHVELVFGSSGNLATQIENGAPFDVFLSADADYPQRLEKEQLTVRNSAVMYATGRLVLWAPRLLPSEVQRLGMEALTGPAVRKIAIANPQHAPYGQAAVSALRYFKMYDQLQSKMVLGENVAQAAQFVISGNADAALVAFSVVPWPGKSGPGSVYELPPDSYPALRQVGVILKRAEQAPSARAFIEFLKSEDAARILVHYGFNIPEVER